MNGVSRRETSTFGTRWSTRDVVYPLVCCALAMAQVTGLVFLIASVAADYPVATVVLLAGGVALEGIATSRWLSARERVFYQSTLYRFAEFTVIALSVRLVTWFSFGTVSAEGGELTRVVLDISQYFTADFLATMVVIAVAWGRATGFDALLTRLVIEETEASMYRKYRSRSERDQYLPRRPQSRASLARELTASWVWGGVFLVICAAITSLELRELEDTINPLGLTHLGLAPLMTLALVVYFGAGLWLISRARHSAMNEWWLVSDASKDVTVDRGWARGSLAALGIIALIATILPTGAGIPLLSWLKTLATGIALLFNALVALLLSLISALLGTTRPESFDPPLPADLVENPIVPSSVPVKTEPLNIDLEPAVGVLAVTVLILVLVYFLRGRFKFPWRFLSKIWTALYRWIMNRNRDTSEQMEDAGLKAGTKTRFRGLEALERILGSRNRHGDGSIQARVVSVYLELLQRASKAGVTRAPGQTPSEYEPLLSSRWPDAEDAIDTLTRSFIKARYSLRDMSADELEAAQRSLKKFSTLDSS